jgi:hypothetical protein
MVYHDSSMLSKLLGSLYFANVLQSDGLEQGFTYLCAVFNRVLRALVQGDDQRVNPFVQTGIVVDGGVQHDGV